MSIKQVVQYKNGPEMMSFYPVSSPLVMEKNTNCFHHTHLKSILHTTMYSILTPKIIQQLLDVLNTFPDK